MGERESIDPNYLSQTMTSLVAESQAHRALFREQTAQFLALYESLLQLDEVIKRQASATMELRMRAKERKPRSAPKF